MSKSSLFSVIISFVLLFARAYNAADLVSRHTVPNRGLLQTESWEEGEYTVYPGYGCAGQNDRNLKKYVGYELEECQQKCVIYPPCISFEWYPLHLNYGQSLCQVSTICTRQGSTYDSAGTYGQIYLYVRHTPSPSANPTKRPSDVPSLPPTKHPSVDPTVEPTWYPSVEPTLEPTFYPSRSPADSYILTESTSIGSISTRSNPDHDTSNADPIVSYLIVGCASFVCFVVCVLAVCYFCQRRRTFRKDEELALAHSSDNTGVQKTKEMISVHSSDDTRIEKREDNGTTAPGIDDVTLDQIVEMAALPPEHNDEHPPVPVPPPGAEGAKGDGGESSYSAEGDSDCVELKAWMKSVGLEQYTAMMIYCGFRDMKDLERMTMEDLKEMGVQKVAHRRKIYALAQTTVTTESGNV